MSDPLFDLEQEFMECWGVVDDIKMLTKYLCDHPKFTGMSADADDEMANLLIGLESLYRVKFENAWTSFEKVTEAYRKVESKQLELEPLDEIILDDAPVSVQASYTQPTRNVYYNTQDRWDMVDTTSPRLNDVTPQEWDRVAKKSYKT